MLRKFIIAVICCLSILTLCSVPSFAATMSDREMAIEQISLCWQTSTNNKNVVSFDSLTSLCADLNRGGYLTEKNGTIFYASDDSSILKNLSNINKLLSTVGFDISSIDRGIDLIANKVFNLPFFMDRLQGYYPLIASYLETIIDKMDNLPASVDNIVVNITEDNSAYNIFYVQDENGDKKSVTSVAGDSMSASGKLLQFLYKLIIGAAISDVDNSISGLNDFFFDNAPSGLGEGVTVWD